jgi:hypothetical protein
VGGPGKHLSFVIVSFVLLGPRMKEGTANDPDDVPCSIVVLSSTSDLLRGKGNFFNSD